MKFIADFHIHSRFSVATSKKLVPEYLEYWARLKGIDVIGTGDCIHPGWLAELEEKLEPAENGLYRLKKEFRLPESAALDSSRFRETIFFTLTGELSSIYKKNGAVRKVHNITFFPDFASAKKVQSKLDSIGNIRSDGRPILGLDSKKILEMVLESGEMSFLVPAHIWTPWFSILGSKSGFNSFDECFDDLATEIFALETGLSSDPPMNRVCSFLDRFTLISNSDAHSPEKLGREANLFDTELSGAGIYHALKNKKGFEGTIEFFPEEGKYHYDGHRKCGVMLDPLETEKHGGICPKCGKPVTKGVMYRVAELADRRSDDPFVNSDKFYSITLLQEVISEIQKQSSSSRGVQQSYFNLIKSIGPEFYLLLNANLEEISESGGELLAEAIKRLRNGNVILEDGYDGDFGRVRVFTDEELGGFSGKGLFAVPNAELISSVSKKSSVRFDILAFQEARKNSGNPMKEMPDPDDEIRIELTESQRRAVEYCDGPEAVIAGPGSGKTRVLSERIKFLIKEKNVSPENILALTFSNRAAAEIISRIEEFSSGNPVVSTFHSLGLRIITENLAITGRSDGFTIADDEERLGYVKKIFTGSGHAKILKRIDDFRHGIISDEESRSLVALYTAELLQANQFDLADLVYLPVEMFKNDTQLLEKYKGEFRNILVDEFQDTDPVQYDFLRLIAGDGKGLFVIGDPDQSIYGFRGADPHLVERLSADFPGIISIKLEKSFRCPENVLKGAEDVLGKKNMLEGFPDEIKISVHESESPASEADWIATSIEKMMGGVRSFSIDSGISDGDAQYDSVSFSDFAILCRSSHQFDEISKALNNHGVACQKVSTDPFYFQEPYLSAIRLARMYRYNRHMDGIKISATHDIIRMIDDEEPLEKLFAEILGENSASAEEIDRMSVFASKFGKDYDTFFRGVMMRKGTDDIDVKSEAVALITMHASKGLEFENVFIAGCDEGIIPFSMYDDSENHIEEEQRLLYVAMTRAKKSLVLSYSNRRSFLGKTLPGRQSRFIHKIKESLISSSARTRKKPGDDNGQMKLF